MPNLRFVERRFAAFLRAPASVRNAMAVIVTATVMTVLIGGVLVWLLDRKDFPNIGLGMWWALQTVTTVGYGDVTPTTGLGRAVAALVMFESIAFISVITAAVTSSFVERARRERLLQEAAHQPDVILAVMARLEDIAGRLERIESTLDRYEEARRSGGSTSGSGP
jgi:voltage-gated potassium channel